MSKNKIDPSKLDRHMQNDASSEHNLKWMDAKEKPIRISGFAWMEQDGAYRRLPLQPLHPISAPVDILANCTAGGQLQFQTNSSVLAIKAKLAGRANMYHMTATGQNGFDCYLGLPGKYDSFTYCSTTRFNPEDSQVRSTMFDLTPEGERLREVRIHFPLYQAVEKIEIGLHREAVIKAPTPYQNFKKIIFYGTSITQGGCASRPGMAYTNILGRRFPYEIINLGFSGNGKGEPNLARMIREIDNPALLVLDYASNVSLEEFRTTLPRFIALIREKHQDVPICIISKIPTAAERHRPSIRTLRENYRSVAEYCTQKLKQSGDPSIFVVDGGTLLGEDFEECTVDGVHPTDLGFSRMAKGLEPIFSILRGGNAGGSA